MRIVSMLVPLRLPLRPLPLLPPSSLEDVLVGMGERLLPVSINLESMVVLSDTRSSALPKDTLARRKDRLSFGNICLFSLDCCGDRVGWTVRDRPKASPSLAILERVEVWSSCCGGVDCGRRPLGVAWMGGSGDGDCIRRARISVDPTVSDRPKASPSVAILVNVEVRDNGGDLDWSTTADGMGGSGDAGCIRRAMVSLIVESGDPNCTCTRRAKLSWSVVARDSNIEGDS